MTDKGNEKPRKGINLKKCEEALRLQIQSIYMGMPKTGWTEKDIE